jgi:hypothetical protein
MKKFYTFLAITLFLSFFLVSLPVNAQTQEQDQSQTNQQDEGANIGTILPQGTEEIEGPMACYFLMNQIETIEDPVKYFKSIDSQEKNNILSCGIRTGRIHFWMIPFYIVYVIEFLVGISGVVAILFLVVAAFRYIFAGAAEGQREAAKTSIKNALLGLIIVFASWIVVNTVQFLLTF